MWVTDEPRTTRGYISTRGILCHNGFKVYAFTLHRKRESNGSEVRFAAVGRFDDPLGIIKNHNFFRHRKLSRGTKRRRAYLRAHFAQWRQRTRNYVAVLLFRREREGEGGGRGVSIRPPRHGGKYKVLTSPYKSTNTLARSRRCTNTSRLEVLLTVCLFCSQRGQLVQGESKISAASRTHAHLKSRAHVGA